MGNHYTMRFTQQTCAVLAQAGIIGRSLNSASPLSLLTPFYLQTDFPLR